MEKFGIFELLDTLSALTAQKSPEKTDDAPQDNPPPAEREQPLAGTNNAFSSLVARQEEISRRIDKNNRR
ncbi:MAG: hypothetical protein J6C93_00580 [Clostridia bacterium]|nr:hypothetical protein [Clostridia bacterium]